MFITERNDRLQKNSQLNIIKRTANGVINKRGPEKSQTIINRLDGVGELGYYNIYGAHSNVTRVFQKLLKIN